MNLVLLRESAPYISISLANVTNKFLKSGVFELDWKNARVTTIYRDDDDNNDENNYRPISVIPPYCKDDRIPCELWNYWFFWKSIVLCQWINLLIWKDWLDHWLENVNDCAITGACLLDISKYFDFINHTILLKKLEMYGITSSELKWFFSYLRGLSKSNFTRNHKFYDIKCGVPQGSVPGPIFFLSFINDISSFAVEACVLNM